MAGLRSWPTGLLGAQDITGIMGNMVLANSGFYARKKFPELYLQFEPAPQKYLPALSWA